MPVVAVDIGDQVSYDPSTERYTMSQTADYIEPDELVDWSPRIEISPIPEPGSAFLVLVGLGGGAYFIRRRRRAGHVRDRG